MSECGKNLREKNLLKHLLQDLATVYKRTGLTGACNLTLPPPFKEAVDFIVQPKKDKYSEVRLAPLAEKIVLEHTEKQKTAYAYRYPLQPLSVEKDAVMPQKNLKAPLPYEYTRLWNAFQDEFNSLAAIKDFDAYFFTVYFLLKKYFSRAPSLAAEDISLFDQARIRAALEDCRGQFREKEPDAPENAAEYLLIEGDISGIQKFIYNMVSPQQERAKLTKRLRGRSFYLILLSETLADYLLHALDLPITHQLWCNGGHFFLLAPNTRAVKNTLKKNADEINRFLLEEFHGDLGCVFSWQAASKQDLTQDMYTVRTSLARQVEREKMRKLSAILPEKKEMTFESKPAKNNGEEDEQPDAALVDSYTQTQNKLHEKIGHRLMKLQRAGGRVQRLLKCYQNFSEDDDELLAAFEIGDRRISWHLSDKNPAGLDTAYGLNALGDKFWGTGNIKYGFKTVATHVATTAGGNKIKDFDKLAEEAEGGFLGVLRMDVDHLGAVFSIGLQQPSLARTAALSADMELFFTGYFQQICESEKYRDAVYINYSGGDDLFVVGAWNKILNLACQVRADFKSFSCNNPDLNISGGIFLCKGKYPIHRAAFQAGDFLDRLAKENSQKEGRVQERAGLATQLPKRNAIAIFNHRMHWDDFMELKEQGDYLVKAIRDENTEQTLNRTFLYKLLNLHKTWRKYRELNTARMYYVTLRSIRNKEVRKKILENLGRNAVLSNESYIPMLIGYSALAVRRNKNGHGRESEKRC